MAALLLERQPAIYSHTLWRHYAYRVVCVSVKKKKKCGSSAGSLCEKGFRLEGIAYQFVGGADAISHKISKAGGCEEALMSETNLITSLSKERN